MQQRRSQGLFRIAKAKNKVAFSAELVCELVRGNETFIPTHSTVQVTIRPGKPWISQNITVGTFSRYIH